MASIKISNAERTTDDVDLIVFRGDTRLFALDNGIIIPAAHGDRHRFVQGGEVKAGLKGINPEDFGVRITALEGTECSAIGIELVVPAGAVSVNGEGSKVAGLLFRRGQTVLTSIGISNSECSANAGGIKRDGTREFTCDVIGRIISSRDGDGDHLRCGAVERCHREAVADADAIIQLSCDRTIVFEYIAPIAGCPIKGETAVGTVEAFGNYKR